MPDGEPTLDINLGRTLELPRPSGRSSDFGARDGGPEEQLLAIAPVHPMRRAAVMELLGRAGAGWPVAARLLESGRLVAGEVRGPHERAVRPWASVGFAVARHRPEGQPWAHFLVVVVTADGPRPST